MNTSYTAPRHLASNAAQRAGALSLAAVITFSLLFGLDRTADRQFDHALLAQQGHGATALHAGTPDSAATRRPA